jgi:hypothetical protein
VNKVEIANFILGLLATAGVAILKLFPETFLSSYLKRKLENKATFEDIGKITERVKEVETKYSKQLEQLRADLDRRKHVSNVQFELEFKTYQEIWNALVEADYSLKAIAIAVYADEKSKLVDSFAGEYLKLYTMVSLKRPFYPTAIWEKLLTLLEMMKQVCLELRKLDSGSSDREYLAKERERFKKTEDQINLVCEEIRSRLTSLEAI